MFDLPSKSDIEKISYELLKQSKSLGVFPTPVNKLIEYSDLRFASNVDLSKVNKSFLDKLTDEVSKKFVKTMSLVRGILDRRERIIYLDLSQLASRQNFVKLHEQGHDILPWQNKVLQCLDDDETLDPNTQEEFEAEANYFASSTLFQLETFDEEMRKLELGIKTPMHLATKFGSSRHAALRKYVERTNYRCALIVLEKSKQGIFTECLLRNLFCSISFLKTFGEMEFPSTLDFNWSFAREYCQGKRFHENGEINLVTKNGMTNFNYHFFNNNYNGFVLLFPNGEVKTKRTKIEIVNSF
jgi:Zn-dependent peptidase ImmA (M78 family)